MLGLGKNAKNWLGGAIAIALAIALALSYTPGLTASRRSPTEHETVMYFFAQNVGETALCDKISWAAYQSYSVLFGEGGASFLRSDCYEQVAQARHDASICWHVRPLIDFSPISAGYSALSCWRRTRNGDKSGIGLADDVLIRTFKQLGYDIDQLHLEGVIQPAIRIRDVYLGLERDPSVIARAEQLLMRPVPSLHADDRLYLAHLAAVATADPKWCESIPAGQTVSRIQMPFRDWCYFTLAFNTQDVRICERMTPAVKEEKVIAAKAAGVRSEIAEQMGLHADCNRSDKRVGPRLHYGPEVPTDERATQHLISALGVPMPSAHDWPTAEVAAFYLQFLFALWPTQTFDPTRDAARAKLVRRLLDLPGDS